MLRQIIKIDEEKCNGCSLCVDACHEGAIGMVEGKAKLLKDDYCDGLGDCLPACPTGAITFEQREALPYDEAAVLASKEKKQAPAKKLPCGCPSSEMRVFERNSCPSERKKAVTTDFDRESELRQFPIQLKLVPTRAPYFEGADILIAADCTAFAYGEFHRDFIKGKITLIGCPKLDEGDYSEKLTEIIRENDIKSVTVVRMEVPCCGGIVNAVKTALQTSGKFIPWSIVTITRDGRKI